MLTEKEALTFMQNVDESAPFWVDLLNENRKTIMVNGGELPRCLYNLILTRRDVNLYLKDIKPHRGWKISDVKAYFGIKGGKQKIADQINLMCSELLEGYINNNDNNE